MAVQAVAAQAVIDTVIKPGPDDTVLLPEKAEIALFTVTTCVKFAEELKDMGLLEDQPDLLPANFAELKLSDKREALIHVLNVLSGVEDGEAKEDVQTSAQAQPSKAMDLDEALAQNAGAQPAPKTGEATPAANTEQSATPAVDKKAVAKAAKAAEKAAKKLAKEAAKAPKTTDQPKQAVSKASTGEPDPIAAYAQKIEKVNSRPEVEEIIDDLVEGAEMNDFMIGGALARVQANKDWWGGSYESLRDYIETATKLSSYRKAMYCIELYNKLLTLDVPYETFGGIGWSKILLLTQIATKENLSDLVDKAKAMSVKALQDYVEEIKNSGKPPKEAAEEASTKTMSFKLHKDQQEVAETAINTAMQQANTDVKAVAFEAICQAYIGTGIAFKKWEDAIAYAAKGSSDKIAFATAVIEKLEATCPDLEINAGIKQKETATQL